MTMWRSHARIFLFPASGGCLALLKKCVKYKYNSETVGSSSFASSFSWSEIRFQITLWHSSDPREIKYDFRGVQFKRSLSTAWNKLNQRVGTWRKTSWNSDSQNSKNDISSVRFDAEYENSAKPSALNFRYQKKTVLKHFLRCCVKCDYCNEQLQYCHFPAMILGKQICSLHNLPMHCLLSMLKHYFQFVISKNLT